MITYYEGVRNYVYYKTGDINLAEDIVQDVFLKVWDSRNTIKSDTIKSLLYIMAGNLIKNHFKHQKVVYEFVYNNPINQSGEAADFEIEQQELSKKLQQVLAAMPEHCRIVFLMNRMDKLTYEEIADRLNLSVKAIEKRMHQALQVIKEKLKHKVLVDDIDNILKNNGQPDAELEKFLTSMEKVSSSGN
ncbi:MAG: sigma-70 family RNA polymerase sigma factor [Bacteroidales bacterium]|nr:sigma-70 family RNA polymerase sigma factor [Bacteroidales bacterium]